VGVLATTRILHSSATALRTCRRLLYTLTTSPFPFLTGLFLATTPNAGKVWLRRIGLFPRDRSEVGERNLHANTLEGLASPAVNWPLLVITVQTAQGDRTSLFTE
jgi:hypothetical protein